MTIFDTCIHHNITKINVKGLYFMDIFETIMDAIDNFDEGFENVLQILNEKIENICTNDSTEKNKKVDNN